MKRSLSAKISDLYETPWIIRQVETHLVFGPLSRYFPVGYALLAASLGGIVIGFFAVHKPIGQYIGSMADKLLFLVVSLMLLRITCRQQAILAWAATKFALGITAFMLLTAGSLMSFVRHQSDAWPNFFLGLIWIPGPEFIASITPHQKYVTIARIFLSIPCIIFGIRSGFWH